MMAGFWLPPRGNGLAGDGVLSTPGSWHSVHQLWAPRRQRNSEASWQALFTVPKEEKKEGKKKKAKTIRQQDLKSDAPFSTLYEWITPTGRVGKLYLVYSLELNICSYWIVQCGVINPAACGNRMLLGSIYPITSSLG